MRNDGVEQAQFLVYKRDVNQRWLNKWKKI